MTRQIFTAHVPKYTLVKEGQKYPEGRNGQLKLFHEHVWPKGFTPERSNAIRGLQLTINTPGTDQHLPNKAINSVARAIVENNLARSTVPIKDLENVSTSARNTPISFDVRNSTEFSSFAPSFNTIDFNINSNRTDADQNKDMFHELGHAVDYANDPARMIKEGKPNLDHMYGKDGRLSLPISEGRAEGYSEAHARITRGQKRTGGDISTLGYSPDGWFFPTTGEEFSTARAETFQKATGHHYEPPVEETKKLGTSKTPTLF